MYKYIRIVKCQERKTSPEPSSPFKPRAPSFPAPCPPPRSHAASPTVLARPALTHYTARITAGRPSLGGNETRSRSAKTGQQHPRGGLRATVLETKNPENPPRT